MVLHRTEMDATDEAAVDVIDGVAVEHLPAGTLVEGHGEDTFSVSFQTIGRMG